MTDYAGTVQRLVLSRTLWLVVAWPLAGFAWQLLVARPRIERSLDAGDVLRELARARVAGFGCVALTATATLGHALLLARLPAGARALYEPVARGARFGELDAGLDLLLDVRSLAVSALACVAALAAAAVLATRPAPERGWRTWAWLHLALAGALASFLADGFVAAAMGWSLAVASGAWLASWRDPAAAVLVATRGALAVGAMLGAAALLFWGLGGTWDADGYARDARPRFAAVHGSTGAGDASLTMTTAAGARVFVDDARETPLRAPFVRAPIPAGSHALRLHLGDGADDALVARLDAAPGEEIALVPLGPTQSFHAMADQMVLRGRAGQPAARRVVEEHVGPGGFAVIAGALLALLGAAFAMSAVPVPLAAPRALTGVAGATGAALGPFLLVRLDFLVPSAQHAGAVIASAGAASLLATVWRALLHVGARRWLVFAAGAPPGLACVALGLGGAAPALQVLVVAGVVATAVHLLLARGGREDEGEVPEPSQPSSPDDALLLRVPSRLGELLVSMERWVVGAVTGAIGAGARIAAWMVATADEHLVASPADVAADGVQRAAGAVEPLLGVTPARIVWAMLALAGLAALAHAVWPGS
jgi:hypothetical protein